MKEQALKLQSDLKKLSSAIVSMASMNNSEDLIQGLIFNAFNKYSKTVNKPPVLPNYSLNNSIRKEENRLCESIDCLTALVKELKPKTKKTNINGLKFTKKELEEMPRLKDFSIRLKNNKYYELRFNRYGYHVSFSSKDFSVAKQKAFAWLSEFESQLKPNVQFAVLSKSDSEHFNISKNIIFKQFADDYVYNIKKKRLKEVSFRNYKNYYEKIILPIYGKMKICDIKPYFIQKFLDKYNAKTPRLCEDLKCLLNGIFEYAVNNGIIDRNPLKAVYIPKHQRKTGTALSPQEEQAFIVAIKGNRFENAYLKMLYSGVRPCEINGIEENTANNTLTVKNGKLKSYQKNLTRTIPIFPKYKDTLDKPITKKLSSYRMELEFKELCPNHTLKDLRHTFTTRARECGIDNELVAVWTGHSLGNITSSVYTHFSMEFQQEQAKKLMY